MAQSNELVIRVVGESTQFTRTITQVNAAINRAGGNATRMGSTFQAAGHSSVTSVQAISASLRLAEGGFTGLLRAGERFIALSPALSNIAKAVFPLVGGIAVGTIFSKLGKETYEFIEQVNKIPEAVQRGYESFNLSQRSVNDALEITNARLDNEIAKLEGKPENTLALQLAEARKQADELASSLAKVTQEQADLLSKNENGPGAQLLGEGTTKYVYGNINNFNKLMEQAARERDLALGRGDQEAADRALGRLHQYQDNALAYYNQNIAGRQRLQDIFSPRTPLGFLRFIPGDQSTNLAALTGARDNIFLAQQQERDQRQQNVAQGVLPIAQNNKKRDADADEAARKAAADAARLKAIDDKAFHDRIKWRDDVVKAYQSVTASDESEITKQIDLSQKWADALDKTNDEVLKKQQQFAAALEKHYDHLGEIQSRSAASLAENNIGIQFQRGQLTPYAAAVQAAQLHTNQYQSDYSRLIAAIQAAQNGGDTNEQYQLEDQLAELQGRRQIESANDQANIRSNTVGGAFNDALNQFVTSSKDAATAMRDIVTGTLNSLNNDIVNGRGFRQTGQDLFRSVAGLGLRRAEGSAISGVEKFFNIGGSKADGSSEANATWVRIAGLGVGGGGLKLPNLPGFGGEWGGGDDGNGGGLFSAIGSAFGGFFANGGTPLPDSDIVVGEEGPEVWHVPSGASGSIIPNHALGGTTNHVYVDATGSQDPSSVEAAVHRAMGQYLPYSVGASVQAVQERQKRRPLSAR